MRPETPSVFAGRYRLLEPLGEGGAGAAYRAHDVVRGEDVALKILHERGPAAALERELDLLGRLVHPALPPVLDFGRADERFYLSSQLVRGASLAQQVPPWGRLEAVLVDVLDALAFLHRLGIRHGDVKPDNVLVEDGRGRLIDLGCAAPLAVSTEVSGTPAFLAPELLQPGAEVDGRADLFALGLTIELCVEQAGTAPARWARLTRRMSAALPADRPDAREALEAVGAADRARAPLPPEPSELLGRDAILARFDVLLDDFVGGRPGPRALALEGGPGSGRTRLLNELKRRTQKRAPLTEARVSQRAPIAWLLGLEHLSIERALGAVESVRGSAPPRVWLIDDADRLEDADRHALEAVVRALEPEDRVLVLACGSFEGPAVERVEVGPLDGAAVRAWARDRIDEREVDELIHLSGGHAGTVRRLLGEALGAGSLAQRRVAAGELDELALDALGAGARAVLAVLAAARGTLDQRDLPALAPGCDVDAAIREALARGLVRVEHGGARLARPAGAGAILAGLARPARSALHASLARWHAARGNHAEVVLHAALAGDSERALTALAAAGEPAGSAWRRAAEALAGCEDPSCRLAGARLLERVGAPREALRALEGLRGLAPERELAARRGACLLKLERAEEALAELGRAHELAEDAEARARVADLASRALMKRGAYAEARARTRDALEHARDPRTVAALHEDLGVALSYLGDPSAREHLEEADRKLEAVGGGARDRVRVASYLAIDAYRRGKLEEAGASYERALAVAEEHRLDDQIAHAALNLGTVHHQRGDLGGALAAYRRAHPIAAALGQKATVATLELDSAQLFADVGALERAAEAEARARESGREFALLTAACAALRAELALARGAIEEAARALEEAREGFGRCGAERELAELSVLEARLALASGERDRAARVLEALPRELPDDVALRRDLVRARLDPDRRAILERVASDAADHGYGLLRAEAEAALAEAWDAAGAPTVADGHRRRAREQWERCAAGLEPALRDAFWAHPSRAAHKVVIAGSPTEREHRLARLLAINRKLGSSLAVQDVLHQAMDAAVELTGAERGFLVLRRDGGLEIAAARNLDRERIGRSHLKLSRSIAERAIETGEIVATVDALEDERFRSNASVHAMKLRSVIAVPIPSPEGFVGALYLDNRFQRGRFTEVDTDLLSAFADQVAIALANARRIEELARRSEELERERARVEELSRGQAAEIERLSAALADRQQVLERRYDYGALVGHAPAMQPVLATLEKVIDSPLTILISGESGTGKELVARAVHFNGPTRSGPFVTVNCAALPDTLLESELFGHERGAFTGADRDRDGLMVAAQGGTLFMDEIGEMSLAMQAKLLRALEEREVRPLGGTRTIAVDFRLLTATNRALLDEARTGRFREDLYYRIGVVEVRLPPLRERLEDLPELVRRILAGAAEELGREVPIVGSDAMQVLLSQRWPGNVRQLQNVLRAALVMAEGRTIEPRHLTALPHATPPPASSRAERDAREKARMLEALETTGWNVTAAARRAGVSRATFYRNLAKHRIESKR